MPRLSVVGDRELPRLLSTGVGQEVDYYSEHLDVSRFPDRDYQDTFSSFLATKYKGHRFDVIVAMQDVAIEFLEQARNTVFPGTPIVYFSTSPSTPRRANSTGVIAEVDLRATVALAAALQPDLRQVFVVSGAQRGDKAYEAMARAQLPSFEPRLTVTYLSGLPSEQLEARLASTAKPLHRPVPARHDRREGRHVPAVGVCGSRDRHRQRADVLLDRFGDEPRHRRGKPEKPGGPDEGHRRAGAPGAERRTGRYHPLVKAGSERSAARLASTQAVGHRRGSHPCGNARAVSRSHRPGIATGAISSARRRWCWRRRR